MRTLYVRNEQDKGPAREQPGARGATPTPTPAPTGKPQQALSFIVGNEHLDCSARVELIRFTF